MSTDFLLQHSDDHSMIYCYCSNFPDAPIYNFIIPSSRPVDFFLFNGSFKTQDIEIDERHGQFLRLKVPTLDLRYAFASLEESKVSPTGCVTDYTVCQNTLEQVFLKFAKLQEQVEGVEEHHVDVIALGM